MGREGFEEMMNSQEVAGIALDDNVVMVMVDNEYKILKSNESAKAYKLYSKNGEVIKEELNNKEFRNITELLI